MSMYDIARFLNINGAVDGRRAQDDTRWLSVPRTSEGYRLRYRLWQGDSHGSDYFVRNESQGRFRSSSVKMEG